MSNQLRVIRKVINGEKIVVKMKELIKDDVFYVDELDTFYKAHSNPYLIDGVWGIECESIDKSEVKN